MYNILLIDEDIEYGNKLMNNLNSYNRNIRFCAYIYQKNNVINNILKYYYDIILIDSKIMYKYYKQLYRYKNQIIIMLDAKEKLNKDDDLIYVFKSDSLFHINNIILKTFEKNNIDFYNKDIIKEDIKKELQYLGYKNKYYGTKYLADAIYILFLNKEDYNNNLKRVVYPKLATKYKRTVQNIKCNIVNATDIMVYDCDEKKLMKYLGYIDYEKPGPKRIIEAVINKIKEKYNYNMKI